jgi:predicted esterase YcpF (UPF0227 family)
MILYIHGFGSSAFGTKAQILKRYFGEESVFAPTLSHIPELAVETLEQFIKIFPEAGVVGSSLGGYYAMHLSNKFGVKSVLINPAVTPWTTLKRAIPQGISYFDNSRYDYRESYLDMLKDIEVKDIDLSKTLLLLQRGDEVLDYRDSEKLFQGGNLLIEDGGDHGFQGFENHMERIEKFLF